MHVTQLFSFPSGDPTELVDLTEDEQAGIAHLQWFWENLGAFNVLQSQAPQTLAHALADSPVGLLGWNGQLLVGLDDVVVGNVALYWLTRTAGSSIRFYKEMARQARPEGPTRGRPMIATGLVLAGLAALLHVYIFTMESLTWTSEATRARFGTTPEQAAATREMAYNQGFYNLFLAVTTIVGIVLVAAGQRGAGAALVLSGAGSMVLAGLVLLLSSPDKRRAALTQLTAPALGVIALVIGLT